MEDWKGIDARSVASVDDLADRQAIGESLGLVCARYPVRVNPFFLALARRSGPALLRQIVPDAVEISPANEALPEDPIAEDAFSPAPNLTHRYPDRVLFLVSDRCPVLCRFCTRKRKVGRGLVVTDEALEQGIAYIEAHPEIRDVLLSGGDPLMLPDRRLGLILERLRAIPSVEILRIGSRVPGALPQRVTLGLVSILSRHQPLYLNLHFNHPEELSPECLEACTRLARAGVPMGSQTVLLKGINDDPETLERLFRRLLTVRIRPYYLFQADLTRGTGHFMTPLSRGLAIMDELRRRMSPMGLPLFTVDLPGGLGKVAVNPGNASLGADGSWVITTPEGHQVTYRDTI